jgi:acetyl esterase
MQGEPEPVAAVSNRKVQGLAGPVPVRLYRPTVTGRPPAIVYFHGGGWTVGDLEVADRPCRLLANAVGAVVVSVGYRLAPEHPFPAAYEDCMALTRWVCSHADELRVDATRVAVAGDSAGGNLAAAVALTARDEHLPLAAQLLAYPVLDMNFSTGSYIANAENGMLSRLTMQWFWDQYIGRQKIGNDTRAVPLRTSKLREVAPAFIATCELDVVRDEGNQYANRLREAGVAVKWRQYDGMVHGGLWMMAAVPSAREVFDDLVSAAREFLHA